MKNYKLQLKCNEIVSIERESEPGIYYRCINTPSGGLMVQDRYEPRTGVCSLKRYMKDNELTQTMVAEALGVCRATIGRYLSGERSIPEKHLKLLGVSVLDSELTKQKHINDLYGVAAKAKMLSDMLDKIIGGVKP
jgi:DNA-binding XRE family transcriptional regulator